MIETRKIALALPGRVAHFERTLHGIMAYARTQQGWSFAMNPEQRADTVRDLRGWRGHGVIAVIDNGKEEAIAMAMDMPVVNLSGVRIASRVPRVMVDPHAIGVLAADHLLQCGFSRFAYYGLRQVLFAQQRGRGFTERLQSFNKPCHTFEDASTFTGRARWHLNLDRMEQWLATLPKPVGIFACTDQRARLLLEACHRLKLRVPDEVAVIGVDNEQVTCEFSHPTLTSVARHDFQVGYEAAKLLHRLMDGGKPPAADILVPPEGVVKRESTDVLAVENVHLKAAVDYIFEHIHKPFSVDDVLEELAISRRSLEHLFADHLNRTPHQFISETRIAKARQLLEAEKPLTLQQIARACGLPSGRQLNLVFKRIVGISPSEYRQQHREQEQ